MRTEKKENQQETRTFLFGRCVSCGTKLHVIARACLICGKEPENILYESHDPQDYIFNISLNNIKKCTKCFNVTNLKKPCPPIGCFGTGRGSCENCRRFEDNRFNCCQEYQKQEGVIHQGDLKKAFIKIVQESKNSGPLANTLTKIFQEPRYEDEIPF
jgi:hypothetical protein